MGNSVELRALQWNEMPDISDVPSLSDRDEFCLQEIKTVLEKYGLASKFGVALLHKHFLLYEDEILVEHCDVENRHLLTKPVRTSEILGTNLVETLWRFDGVTGKTCEQYCPTDEAGRHYGYKEHG